MNSPIHCPRRGLFGLVSMSLLLALAAGCPFDGHGDPICEYYVFRDRVYDCSKLDRCTEPNFDYRLACCECNPEFCNVDPTCPVSPCGSTVPEGKAPGMEGAGPMAVEVEKCSPPPIIEASSCMTCHNGSAREDYAGSGLSNPHPFANAAYMSCVACHGGNPSGRGKDDSHVPAPPAIGDRQTQQNDPFAFFNRTTLTGIDKLEPYAAGDRTYTALEFLQFVNPGDLRVVSAGQGCGQSGCHGDQHGAWVNASPMATQAGIYGSALHAAGLPNAFPDYRGWYLDTAADFGFRAVSDPDFVYTGAELGRVGMLAELPENAHHGAAGGIYQNPLYTAAELDDDVHATSADGAYANQIIAGTPLHDLYQASLAMACGGCHLGSAGRNDRFAEYRSSGCTACHMSYDYDGRSHGLDPNIAKNEPRDPDALAPGERAHPPAHQIRSVARILDQGAFVRGIDDRACAGCHVGSNATYLQYRGVRPDQNQAVVDGLQYPANPVSFSNTARNTTLFSPVIQNRTFAGRTPDQLLEFEDYDGDNRDDSPADIHHERGMACIDCHASRDLHNGTAGDASSGALWSRQDQALALACESCHGSIAAYAPTVSCVDYHGAAAECAADRLGNPLRNVTVDERGDYWLRGRIDGVMHYVIQTRDTVVQNNKDQPLTGSPLYSPRASYAMGRVDGDPQTGLGPRQGDPALVSPGFAHSDTMDCVSCHASWTNNCYGCHLATAYDAENPSFMFSNTTGQRIVLSTARAAPVYSTPVPFLLGVNTRNRITQTAPGMGLFFRYEADLQGNRSKVFAFTDRQGNGNNPGDQGRGAFAALGHGHITPHSIRGRVDAQNEGPRYCVSCHLDQAQISTYGPAYAQFYADMQSGNLGNLNHTLLAQHIGQNPGNQLGSPYWVHMAAGLGSGLFLFDAQGCPVNPLDTGTAHAFCNGDAPATRFDVASAVYQLDRVVESSGVANASTSHPLSQGAPSELRAGALDPGMAGPLGGPLVDRLASPTTGLILDGWLDADGQSRGTATSLVP